MSRKGTRDKMETSPAAFRTDRCPTLNAEISRLCRWIGNTSLAGFISIGIRPVGSLNNSGLRLNRVAAMRSAVKGVERLLKYLYFCNG
jgi:hypothetical protein